MELTKNDYEKIKKIFHLTSVIINTYKKLSILESEGKENTKEYNNTIKSLKKLIENEKKLYKSANIDANKSEIIAKYIKDGRKLHKLSNNIESIIIGDEKNQEERRILNKLNKIYINDYSKIFEKLNITDPEGIFLYTNQEELKNRIKKEVYSGIMTEESIKDDIKYSLIKLIDDFVKSNQQNKDLNNKLIKAKYNLSLINENIERYLLENTFHIPKLYLSSRLISDMYQVEDSLYKLLILSQKIDNIDMQMIKILITDDSEYNKKDTITTITMRQLLLRATFILLDDSIIEDINYNFHNLIEKSQNINGKNNNISENAIIQVFKSIKKDKEKPYTLSLKPIKNKNT